jgi:diaminohydroxyphosphoribosylaminopyrimidine deaminase/5-amino-6-(5-phosphoribosylamino)uracil reductase
VTAAIDEQAAWSLTRAIAAAVREPAQPPPCDPEEAAAPLRVEAAGAWLEVEPSAAWRASAGVADDARELFDLYLPIAVAADLVLGQLGQSLDGRIATETGASHFITGPRDIERLHRVRALVDAVIVGANTVATDDPRLTVREVEGDDPVRVVLDPDARLDRDRRVFSDGGAPTLTVQRGTDRGRQTRSDQLFVSASKDGGLDLQALVEKLRALGLRRILVEGGGVTVSRFVAAGLLDRLHLTLAPLLIGSGRPSLTLEPVTSLDEALRPRFRHFHLGDDVLFDLDLRRPARP